MFSASMASTSSGSLAVEGEFIDTDFGNTDRVVQAFIDTVTGSRAFRRWSVPLGPRASSRSRVSFQCAMASGSKAVTPSG